MAFSRREFLSSTTLALAGTAFARLPLGAQTPAQAPPATAFTDLHRGVGIFTGQGGTIGWLVTRDGAIAVDSQFPQTAQACVDGLKQRSAKGIQMLINTHHHGDHVAGNPTFRPAVGAIVQQERCAKLHKQTTEKAGTAAQQAFADVTFGESWSKEIGGEKVWANYYGPGHTGGDAVIFFERANVVHMGDLMFNRLHPFIDRPAGASIKNWIKILERVSKRHRDALYIFGHAKETSGVTGDAKELLYFRDYLSAALDFTRKGIKEGKSQAEIAKADVLPGFPDYVSPMALLSLPNVLKVAHEELTNK